MCGPLTSNFTNRCAENGLICPHLQNYVHCCCQPGIASTKSITHYTAWRALAKITAHLELVSSHEICPYAQNVVAVPDGYIGGDGGLLHIHLLHHVRPRTNRRYSRSQQEAQVCLTILKTNSLSMKYLGWVNQFDAKATGCELTCCCLRFSSSFRWHKLISLFKECEQTFVVPVVSM